ncbi:MAG: capsule assembly Wzi family protein [Fibrobacterota bacterium]
MKIDLGRLCLAFAFLSGAALGEFLPLDHPVYRPLDFLVRNGRIPALNSATRPYDADAAFNALSALDTAALSLRERTERTIALAYLGDRGTPGKAHRLRISLSLNGTGEKADSTDYFARGALGLVYSFGNFTFVDRVQADRGSDTARFDQLDRQFKKSVPADMPQAYLAWSGKHFGALFGRNSAQWGPGRFHHLLLSDHQPSLNMVSAWARLGFLKATSLSAKLNPVIGWDRYFSAMRLSFQITPDAYLAINQSIVYAGEHRPFELYYLLPCYLYYFSQFGFTHSNESENIFLSADGEWRVRDKVNLYFEFLADDFQVDSDPISKGVQNAVAFVLGAECPELNDVYSAGAEYTRANSYVYKHMGGWPTHYIANTHGGVLGDELGPDAEALHLWSARQCGRYTSVRMRYDLTRRGDLNSVYGTWDAYDKADEPMPHGTVETTHTLALKWERVNWNGLSAGTEAGYLWTSNQFHIAGNNASGPLFQLSLDYRFQTVLRWDTRESLFE